MLINTQVLIITYRLVIMRIRILKAIGSNRGIETLLIHVASMHEADTLAASLAQDRLSLVDLIDNKGLIIKRYT